MERPLFLPQYVSAAPLMAPSPADFPSCINTITVNTMLININTTIKIVLNTATLIIPPAFVSTHNFSYHNITCHPFQVIFHQFRLSLRIPTYALSETEQTPNIVLAICTNGKSVLTPNPVRIY